jgi:hypothetical protein
MSNDKQGVARDTDFGPKPVELDYRSHRLWRTKYMRGPSDHAAAREVRAREVYWLRRMGLIAPETSS